MAEELGRRERKKQQTRERIAETARRLFGERGFERVTVAEIAREADVAEQTVYNYFPTKEDLVYWRLESFEEALLGAVRDREPGESMPAAFGRWLLAQRGLLGETPLSPELVALTRMITESPSLLDRERQIFARYADSLAGLIAAETGAAPDDVVPVVTANALLGVHRALVNYARRRILDGARNPELQRDVRAQAEAALAALEGGFGAGAHERRQQQALNADAQQRRVGHAVVGARQPGELARVARQPPPGQPPGVGQGDHLGEHPLEVQGGADLDSQAGLVGAGVGEGVGHARGDLDHVAGAGEPGAEAEPEAHAPLDDLEALGLDGVDVRDRDGAAGAEGEVEREQLAAGAGRGVGEGEALARDRVLEGVAGEDGAVMCGHGGQSSRARRDDPWPICSKSFASV